METTTTTTTTTTAPATPAKAATLTKLSFTERLSLGLKSPLGEDLIIDLVSVTPRKAKSCVSYPGLDQTAINLLVNSFPGVINDLVTDTLNAACQSNFTANGKPEEVKAYLISLFNPAPEAAKATKAAKKTAAQVFTELKAKYASLDEAGKLALLPELKATKLALQEEIAKLNSELAEIG